MVTVSCVRVGYLSMGGARTRDSLCRDLTTDSWEDDEEAVEDDDVWGNGSEE